MSRAWRKELKAANLAMAAQTEPYEIEVAGIHITVNPNTFSPRYFTDSAWFAEEMAKIVGKRSLLEIGTGTGIVALVAGLNGANGLATDVTGAAVTNARKNFRRYNVFFDARQSDIYSKVRDSERFDVIFWNHPFNRTRVPKSLRHVPPELSRAGFDPGYRALERYIAGGQQHLESNGRGRHKSQLLLGTGDGADQKAIGALAKQFGYEVKLLKEKEMPLTPCGTAKNTYFIIEFLPKR